MDVPLSFVVGIRVAVLTHYVIYVPTRVCARIEGLDIFHSHS